MLDGHGIAPTYVVDYQVAVSAESVAILGAMAASGRCTIGAHLHPWVTPPHEGPVDARHSFAGNLAPGLERAKLAALTRAIEAGFGARPTIYKAGRYGVGPATAEILDELGYDIDCSVVPLTSFARDEGPDFSALTDQPFMVTERLAELPLSVGFTGVLAGKGGQIFPLAADPPGAPPAPGGIGAARRAAGAAAAEPGGAYTARHATADPCRACGGQTLVHVDVSYITVRRCCRAPRHMSGARLTGTHFWQRSQAIAAISWAH